MSENFEPFLVKHGYCNSAVSKYLFRSAFDSEGFYHPSSGIIHLLSKITSSWTIFHETRGHNMLLTYNAFPFQMDTIKHELLLKLISICKESNCRIELPVLRNNRSLKDIRAEGAIEAISRLDRFCENFYENSMLTHEGYSDKIADYETNVDSLRFFESEKESNPDLECHVTGMKLAETIEEKFGRFYLGWAASVALNTEAINPLNPEIDLDSYFKDRANQPDARFKMLAGLNCVGTPFPTESQEHRGEFMKLAKELFPKTYTATLIDLAENDSDLRKRLKKFYALQLEIIGCVPYLGADWSFVKSVYSQIWKDSRIWHGSISRLKPMVEYRKGKDFKVAWKNWEKYLGSNDLSKVLRNPDVLQGILEDKIFYGLGLVGEFFYFNPPVIVRDFGDESVDLLIRPDIERTDRKRLLLKDFLESLSKVLLGKFSISGSDSLLIPCYMGVENTIDCNPQEPCLARRLLENFEPSKSLTLMCRAYNKKIPIRSTSN